MTSAHQASAHDASTRLTGALLLAALAFMVAGAAIVVPSGLTLNPADPAATLEAVHDQVGLHLTELALDVLGWLALTAAGLLVAGSAAAAGSRLAVLPAGLLAASGLAGLLHDAGNLAVTQLAADPSDPTAVATAQALLLTAKWGVNLAGLLWVAATVAAAAWWHLPKALRLTGWLAALCGLGAVVVPWTTGTDGPSPALEQRGYALHLAIMLWFAVLGWRHLRGSGVAQPPAVAG